jgi:hypothetical protein
VRSLRRAQHPLDSLEHASETARPGDLLFGDIVYFVQCNGADGPIKIGWTRGLRGRLKELRIANPYRLTVLGALKGRATQEAQIQARFKHLRVAGEWFTPAPELLAFIREHARKTWRTE